MVLEEKNKPQAHVIATKKPKGWRFFIDWVSNQINRATAPSPPKPLTTAEIASRNEAERKVNKYISQLVKIADGSKDHALDRSLNQAHANLEKLEKYRFDTTKLKNTLSHYAYLACITISEKELGGFRLLCNNKDLYDFHFLKSRAKVVVDRIELARKYAQADQVTKLTDLRIEVNQYMKIAYSRCINHYLQGLTDLAEEFKGDITPKNSQILFNEQVSSVLKYIAIGNQMNIDTQSFWNQFCKTLGTAYLNEADKFINYGGLNQKEKEDYTDFRQRLAAVARLITVADDLGVDTTVQTQALETQELHILGKTQAQGSDAWWKRFKQKSEKRIQVMEKEEQEKLKDWWFTQ